VSPSDVPKSRHPELLLQEQGNLGINICPFSLLYPQDGVCWNVGPLSHNVFERSLLIRLIHDVGRESLFLDYHDIISNVINLTNPINRASAPRINAMSLIEEPPPARWNTLRLLRQMSGEPMNDPDLVITNEQMQHMLENLEWVVRRAGSTITALRSNREGAIDVDADNVHDNIGEARRTMGDGQRIREGIDIGAANEEERRVRMRHDDHSVRPDEELLAESDNSVSSIDSIMGVPVGRHSTAGRTHTAGRNGTAGRTAGRGATGRGATGRGATGHGGSRGGSRGATGRGAAGRGATGHGATGRGVTNTGRDAVGISSIDAAASAASSNPANVDATDDVFADVSMRRPLGSFVNATNIRDASRAEAIINIF
jgi:hypothetical protein